MLLEVGAERGDGVIAFCKTKLYPLSKKFLLTLEILLLRWAQSMDGEIDIYKHFTWLKRSQVNHLSSANNETYQERLARLEGDKESLILQVSVLTDQVEAQGEKIRDLEVCLEGHQLKLNATEEMLQQELLSRTSLETQKLDLMAEVSDLKIKLVGMEKEQSEYEEKQNKAESVVNLISELQDQMCRLQLEINSKIQERKSQDRKLELTANDLQASTRSVVESLSQKNCSLCDV